MTISHRAFNHLSSTVQAASYAVELEAVPWRFGGLRWFICCPLTWRSVLKLYLPNGAQRFASRQAYQLAYASQRHGTLEAGHARLSRAYGKLGAVYQRLRQPIPSKPKWMRHPTYRRLVAEIEAAQMAHEDVCNAGARRFIARQKG